MLGRRARRSALAVGAAVAVFPAPAAAHGGLVGRADLPIPEWLVTWAAAVVLVISFVGLAVLWREPRLDGAPRRPLPTLMGRALTHPVLEALCGLIGVAVLALVIWSGLAGEQSIEDNFAPTLVYVVFWVGLVFASALLGDVFRAFNPWRAIGRATSWTLRTLARADMPPLFAYPRWLGRWPAAAGIVAFTWLELIAGSGTQPSTVAAATIVYSAAMFLGMAAFGVEEWSTRGDGFAAYFNLFSRLSIFAREGRDIVLRRPLSGLADLEPLPGTVALLAVMIGTVSFDGAGEGELWQSVVPDLNSFWADLGFNALRATELTFAVGFVVFILAVAALYRLGVLGASRLQPRRPAAELGRLFVHSLVPIAFAYAAAHYVSLLVYQGQKVPALISDPLADGTDWLGTGPGTIDYGVASATFFWYVQVALVLVGHAAGLALAHDKALVVYRDAKAAIRSQYWLLGTMVVFTGLALWLLSQQNEG